MYQDWRNISPRRQVSWLPGVIRAAFPSFALSGRWRDLPGHSCGGSRGLGRDARTAFPFRLLAEDRRAQSYARVMVTSNGGERVLTEESDAARRHRAKMEKRKAVQDAEVAGKTIRRKGLLMVHTGPGKGKSTAAFGLALRALGHGWKVGVVQFGKGAWRSGEREMLERLGEVSWHTLGEGFTWETQDRARDEAAARRAWEQTCALMDDPDIRLLVLDELNISLRYEHLPLDEVLARFSARRDDLHIVVTGRNAKPELVEAADLVTEMTLVKHHFAAGVKAQEGIEF
jgi:cob(I)alamin adenosyltransferase